MSTESQHDAEPVCKLPAGSLSGAADAGVGGAGRVESIAIDAGGQVVVRIEGRAEPYVKARIARCFPWSLGEMYISICDKDGKEIAMLRTLEGLTPDSRRIVERELRDKVFSPRIRRVLDCKSEFGVISITADTDRGEVTFQVRTRDDIRVLSPTHAIFRDADGIAYELPDLRALDAHSVKYLEEFF